MSTLWADFNKEMHRYWIRAKVSYKYIACSLAFLSLGGYSQMEKMQIDATCSTNAAYAAGINDGKSNKNMRSDYAAICPTNQV